MSVITKELHFRSLDFSIIGQRGCSLLPTTLSGSKIFWVGYGRGHDMMHRSVLIIYDQRSFMI